SVEKRGQDAGSSRRAAAPVPRKGRRSRLEALTPPGSANFGVGCDASNAMPRRTSGMPTLTIAATLVPRTDRIGHIVDARGAAMPLRDIGVLHPSTQEGKRPVDKVRVYYDRTGNTLTVWFGDPQKESVCEEIADDVVLMKDRRGRVIGFERLNYLSRKQQGE